ncbi:LEAF RUST 10 DISEASE-RESISTANCE LOCUS RECEPTOR-LIKE PROTEIN KINASE-like 2.3 [Tasmannia lanceolata]|uniref:LEAF RUST 10 DISEASE-RESISTANCE LOCUS RECEPTOR-LIKE PROTEIN KINASE-like 2.3 n=1 Tax=Tasmannia lanceolata TaxID=3420 RepID=UPI00406307A6
MKTQMLFIILFVLIYLWFCHPVKARPSNCSSNCGNVTITYPFGIGEECFLAGFEVTCDKGVPFLVNASLTLVEILFPDQVRLLTTQKMAVDCQNLPKDNQNNCIKLEKPFTISGRGTRFVAMGCDTKAYVTNNNLHAFECSSQGMKENGGDNKHGGLGHCQSSITDGENEYCYNVTNSYNYPKSSCVTNCSFAVLAEAGYGINESVLIDYTSLANIVSNSLSLPLVADWAVGGTEKCPICGSNGRCNTICGPNTVCNDSGRGWGYTCQCKDDYKGNPYLPGREGCKGQGMSIGTKLILGVTVGIGSFFLVFLLFGLLFHKKGRDNVHKKRKSNAHNVEAFLQNYGSLTPQRYSYSDIKKMTSSFIDKLGQGGFGAVFKGKLRDGRLVAVKILRESKGGEEFINEVASIGKTYHVNIVSLLGFCAEGSKRALVYEFMPNGSLEKFIYAEKSRETDTLGWETLYQIAVGIAKGLEYLHRGCSTRILHFDIKPHNILLDHDFCPKISDFGLAKLCPNKDSIISTLDARGTVGYIAPEIFCRNIGRASHKSDVYSYGMMMLEIVGRRKNIDVRVEDTSEIYFPHWIYKRLDLNYDLGLHGVTTEEEEKTARKMILVGLWCIQTDPANRPSMNRVLEMLEGTLESLQMPPKPFLSSPKRSSHDSSTMSMIISEGSP